MRSTGVRRSRPATRRAAAATSALLTQAAVPLISAATSRHRLQFDLRAEWKRAGLERKAGGRALDVCELVSPPGVQRVVVADVVQQALDVDDLVDRISSRRRDRR